MEVQLAWPSNAHWKSGVLALPDQVGSEEKQIMNAWPSLGPSRKLAHVKRRHLFQPQNISVLVFFLKWG
jgi:hypothetical protein